jgi:multidrug efflux pump subunit AcrB
MHISEIAFKNKPIFWFLLVCIVAGGVLSYQAISKLEDPEIVVMFAKVYTIYPGASAHEVEMQVTSVLEEEISTLADIENIRSKSSANISEIDIELKMTVPQDEIQQRWEFLRRKVEAAQTKLPEGAQKSMVIDDFTDVYGMFYAMTADGYSYQEMDDYAGYIKRGMLEVEGVRKVQIYGTQSPQIEIRLSSEKMGEMGVSPLQVINAIQGQNTMVYPGSVHTGDQLLKVNVSDKLTGIEDLKNLMVQDIGGKLIKLSDLADISKTYPETFRNTMFMNNKKAIGISISMESGENIVELGKRVDKQLAELQKNMPVGFEFSKVWFQPDKVNDAIRGFMINLVESVIIVVLSLMITMGLRSGLIIGTGLLLTILGTFPFLLVADGSMQRISLGAFIVAMGMLVDNAIVVLDGILVDLQRNGKNKNTFVNPAKRTAWPLLGATLIAVSAFLPVFISKDTAGTYARDLFVVLCISLLISWILALTQVPLFSAKFLTIPDKKKNKDPFDGVFYRTFSRALSFFMSHKVTTVIATTLLLAVSAYGFTFVKQTFFPDMNYNQVYIEYKLPYGTSPDKVCSDLAEITDYFLTLEEVKMVVSSGGMTPTRYCLVRSMGEVADNYGELIVNFEDYETMVKMKPVLEEYIRENYPDAYFRIRKYNLSVKSTHLVEAEFSGPDPAVLKHLSQQVEEIMRQNPYADTYTISNDWEPMGKALFARYDQNAARRTATTRSDVSNAILAATDGLPLGTVYEGETALGIVMKVRNSDGSRIENLNNIPVWNMIPNFQQIKNEDITNLMYGIKTTEELTGELLKPIPLSAITQGVDLGWEESVVQRVNSKRSIQAQCDPIEGYSPALLRKTLIPEINKIEIPEGYNIKWVGEYELQSTALRNIFKYLPVVIMLIIFTLILLFNDIKRPVIVIVCIPLAIIGIVPGLLISDRPFTFMAIIGSIGLMGMLIKNSIVLLDEIQKQIHEGQGSYQAIINATISRTRPVLMASFTTILGMLPLFTDPMYSSMAVVIISGLLVGTLITLIFVPILYAVLHNIHKEENVKILTD